MELISRMSSGHAIVLLTITKLVARVEEKTLVLLDEPESHLHPPLLSAFIRALSELLHDRNGVAIIATHSPVVLQEIPSCCAWKINRSRLVISTIRPEIQIFGENVGVLTREVFGLEVKKSGFHKMLDLSVQRGGSFDEIMREYNFQLGFEAQAILRAMLSNRDLVIGQ
jgi:ABC-type multidrug transport system ATPase subunit